MQPILDDLRETGGEIRETHISWVLMGKKRVLKLKKPVNLGFVDYSSLPKRKEACRKEVALNRRLAPDVYLGVAPVTRSPTGRFELGGEGEICEYAVVMRRLPDEERADSRLRTRDLEPRHLDRAAETIADFHRAAQSSPAIREYGRPERIEFNLRENFAQTTGKLERFLSKREARELKDWQFGWLDQKRSLFEARVRGHHIREGHGDLRLEHLYFDSEGAVQILDGIEFSERLRNIDVCCDIAFLAMDLGMHGRTDWAERLLARYARAAQDYDLYQLVDFYESYRAFVRGKIACMMLDDPEHDAGFVSALEARARRYFRLALASGRRTVLEPAIIGVAGLIASGKSTVSEALSERMSAPVIDSDRTRKALLGVEPHHHQWDPEFSGAYHPEITRRTYDEILRRCRIIVESGRPVVVDATFRAREHRRLLKALAAQLKVPFRLIECRVSRVAALSRLAQRESEQGVVSDGREEIWDAFAETYEPPYELHDEEFIAVDSERPLEDTLGAIERRVPTWPKGLVG